MRELDEAVAIEVMGWTSLGYWTNLDDPPEPDDLVGVPPGGEVTGVPRYGTTGDGMLAVIGRMRELGWFCILWTDDGGSYARFWRGAGVFCERDSTALPPATAEAALAAVRRKSGNLGF